MGIRILIPRPRRRARGAPRRRLLWLASAFAVLSIANSFFDAQGRVGAYRAEAEVERLESEVDAARAVNAELADRLEQLRSDPATVEREARERLGLVRPGEKVYLLPHRPGSAEEPEEAASAPDPTDGEASH